MKKITVNFEKYVGKIKPFHAINNAPLLGIDNQIAQNGDLTQEELKELEKYKEFLIYKRKK